MSFEDIPEDKEQSFPCDTCGGNVTKNNQEVWECDSCSFSYQEQTTNQHE